MTSPNEYSAPPVVAEKSPPCRQCSRPAPAGKSTVVEDITFEGAAIVQAARTEGYKQGAKDEREKVLDEIIKLARCGKCPFPKKKAVVCESTNDFECIPCLANSLRSEEVR